MTLARIVATVFGIGFVRPAPGTWGALAALPFAWILHLAGGPGLLGVAILLVFFGGWWSTVLATRGHQDHDPSEIVIDEVVGQWCALFPVSLGASLSGAPIGALWPGWVTAFILFRLFDIWKPGPVRWADQREDALGVMLDDVVAGVMAAFGVVLLAGIFHGILLL